MFFIENVDFGYTVWVHHLLDDAPGGVETVRWVQNEQFVQSASEVILGDFDDSAQDFEWEVKDSFAIDVNEEDPVLDLALIEGVLDDRGTDVAEDLLEEVELLRNI